MKLFTALMQSLILALIAWLCSGSKIKDYQALAAVSPEVLTGRYMTETIAKDGKNTPKYRSRIEAAAKAEKDIALGKRLANAGGVKIVGARLALTFFSAVGGFMAWFIAFFIVFITTKPLDSVLDSIWGNVTRYYLGPIIPVTALGFFAILVTLEVLIEQL